MTQRRPDRRSTLFFVSYAHPVLPAYIPLSLTVNNHILRFFADLSIDVGELAGSDNGAYPGFIDRQMSGGQRWSDELSEEVGSCQVFLPLVSPNLVASPWCGKEWDAFSRRKLTALGPALSTHQTAILPVMWVPMSHDMLPKVIQDIQFFSPALLPDYEIAEKYKQDGLLGLLRTNQLDAYRMIVWRLAQQVVDIYRTWRVEPSKPDLTKLRNVFDDALNDVLNDSGSG